MSAVERERRGHVEILTINRPEARNAVNGDVSQGMASALDELEADDDCWVVILTGAGEKAFSAGMDLKAFASGEGGPIMGAPGGFAGIVQRTFPKPIIAAVNGAALAGGLRDHAGLRPGGGGRPRHVRHSRGQAGAPRRCRWSDPSAQAPPAGHRPGAGPHRRADRRRRGPWPSASSTGWCPRPA